MASEDHFETFKQEIEVAAVRQYPSELELQQSATDNFGTFFDAVKKWNATVSKNWFKATVRYKFGRFDSRNESIELLLLAEKPDGELKTLNMTATGKTLLPQTGEFNQKFGHRQPPRWDAHEMDDLLPRMTQWLLVFFKSP